MPTGTGHLTHEEMADVYKKGGSVIQADQHFLTEGDVPSDAELAQHDPMLARHTLASLDSEIARLASQRQYVQDVVEQHKAEGRNAPDGPKRALTGGAAAAPLEERIRRQQEEGAVTQYGARIDPAGPIGPGENPDNLPDPSAVASQVHPAAAGVPTGPTNVGPSAGGGAPAAPRPPDSAPGGVTDATQAAVDEAENKKKADAEAEARRAAEARPPAAPQGGPPPVAGR